MENVDLAIDAWRNENYDDALSYLRKAYNNHEIWPFFYYYFSGRCHAIIGHNYDDEYDQRCDQKRKELGLPDDDNEDSDGYKDEFEPLWKKSIEERDIAHEMLLEALNHKQEECFVAPEKDVAGVFWYLALTSPDVFRQKRRYLMAAMAWEEYREDAKDWYEITTNRLIDIWNKDFQFAKEELAKAPNDPDNIWLVNNTGFCSDEFGYHERQFIYIARDVNALAGCYDDNIKWLFTIDALPNDLTFPVGHPQPNMLYYAHPAKRGYYLPMVAGIDEELFDDKIRDFRRMAQCLGATEITFRSIKGRSLSEDYSDNTNVEVGGDYKAFGGGFEYGGKKSGNRNETMRGQRELVQRFDPQKAYVPNDVAWLSVDPEWQSLVKQRLEGNMLHYSIRISSKQTMSVTDSQLDDVKVAFKSFVFNAHVNFSEQLERSFQREEETEWEISVNFKPLNELEVVKNQETASINGAKLDNKTVESDNSLTDSEQEYLDNLKELLEDGAEITPRERKMLNRIRQTLGISEERAKELEDSMVVSQLTEDEQEYLEMYREYAEDGVIDEKERRRLDKFASGLGISNDRKVMIEKM